MIMHGIIFAGPDFWKLILSMACVCVYVYACVSVCLPPKLVIPCSVMWTPFDWLNKFYNFYKEAVVGIDSRWGLRIQACCRNQPNRSKIWIHFNSHLKQLYISNKMEHFRYKGLCGIHWCTHIETLKRRASFSYKLVALEY